MVHLPVSAVVESAVLAQVLAAPLDTQETEQAWAEDLDTQRATLAKRCFRSCTRFRRK
jgi:hypothetical protein